MLPAPNSVAASPASPFSSVLNSNYAPTSREVEELRSLLVKPRKRLSKLNEEIYSLQEKLNLLVSERDQVQSYIDAHTALLSPLRQIPADTLADIFLHCLPTSQIPSMSRNEAPLLLTRVSRRWRDVALATPRLWCAIHVFAPIRADDKKVELYLQQKKEGMETWLGRSGALPLSISLNMKHNFTCPRPRKFNPSHRCLIEYLKTLSRRWKRIELSLCETALRSLDSLKAEDVPLLESIAVDYRDSTATWQGLGTRGPSQSYLPNFASLLALRGFCLLHFHKGSAAFKLPVTGNHLTELTLKPLLRLQSGSRDQFLSMTEALDILAALPRLRLCNITVLTENLPQDKELVYLPSLRELTICMAYSFPVETRPGELGPEAGFFAKLVTSSELTSLAVDAYRPRSNPRATRSQVPFFSLPLVNLKSLTIRMPISSEALTECLESVPLLESLRVLDYSSDDARIVVGWGSNQRSHVRSLPLEGSHLALLTPSDTAPIPLCPRLRRLTFTGYNETISDAAICNFARARWAIDCHQKAEIQRLEFLHVALHRVIEQDISSALLKLKTEGMDIRVRYLGPGPDLLGKDPGYISSWPFAEELDFRPIIPYAVDVV